MIRKIGFSLLLIAALCRPLPGQGSGCSPTQLWQLSGDSGSTADGPGGAAGWQADIATAEMEHGGGPPTCTYTWFSDPYGGHYYGDCVVYVWTGTCSPPPPPPSGPSCPICGSPISLTNGNVYIQQTDVKVPGLGTGLNLSRTWNSMWPPSESSISTGLFGPNWRSTYEERIFAGDDGTVKYARADGSFWSFMLYSTVSDPTYVNYQPVAPANAQASLAWSATQWTLTFNNGEQRTFDPTSGFLTSIIDRNGNTTSVSYDSLDRLVTVADPGGRHLYFSYASDSSYLVTNVTSDISLSLSYAYDTEGRLIQVTKPDSTTVSFVYDSNSMITAVNDNDDVLLESHTYDSAGRGLTSSRASGVQSVTVSYPND
jgi:YD repeat-containing protein